MSHHITINGQTFDSVEQMPPEIRRQYEAILQTLEGKSGDADANLNISARTTKRFIVNGREYHRLEDVPREIRDAIGDAALVEAIGVQDGVSDSGAQKPWAGISNRPASRTPGGPSFCDPLRDSSIRVTTMRLNGLILLLAGMFIAGLFLGVLAGLFIAGKLH